MYKLPLPLLLGGNLQNCCVQFASDFSVYALSGVVADGLFWLDGGDGVADGGQLLFEDCVSEVLAVVSIL